MSNNSFSFKSVSRTAVLVLVIFYVGFGVGITMFQEKVRHHRLAGGV